MTDKPRWDVLHTPISYVDAYCDTPNESYAPYLLQGKKRYNRRSIRLPGYDYSKEGFYFVTICTYKRKCLFGKIKNGKIHLNKYGDIVKDEWIKTEKIRKNIKIDKFVIMPNHIHGIIVIEKSVGANCNTPLRLQRTFKSPSNTIGAIIRGFKSAVTNRINRIRKTFGKSVWQRNYYEHIIRNENDYLRIAEYIKNNPLKWELDKYYVE